MKLPSASELCSLIGTACGEEPADVVIINGSVVNVYSGEIIKRNIALRGERIAYVGPENYFVGEKTTTVDAQGYYLVPGYIEPHDHPSMCHNPVTYAEAVLPLGTTTIVGDMYSLLINLSVQEFIKLNGYLQDIPLKYLWFLRSAPPTNIQCQIEAFRPEKLLEILQLPNVMGFGEISRWKELLTKEPTAINSVLDATVLRKRLDGHTAGSTLLQLNALKAGGISGCHESIHPKEALERLRLGMYVALRESSIRSDLQRLVSIIVEEHADTNRLMLTTDGSSPQDVKRNGHLESRLDKLVACGVKPIQAVKMVTLNPATYYRVDDQIGGISPGLYADLLLLKDFKSFRPEAVFAKGALVAEKGNLLVKIDQPDWVESGVAPIRLRGSTSTEIFQIHSEEETILFPVIKVSNTVLTRREDVIFPVSEGVVQSPTQQILKLAYLDFNGKWIANGFINNFLTDFDAVAWTVGAGFGVLVLGKTPEAMLQAVEEISNLGGGIVFFENGSLTFSFPLPLLGSMSMQSLVELAETEAGLMEFARKHGYKYKNILYTLHFLSITDLPEIRITPAGIYDTAREQVIYPSTTLV